MKELIQKYRNRKYIFILGSGRNGTTFLAKELAKVKSIATTPEDKFFFWSMSYRKKYNLNKVDDFIKFLDLSFNFIFNFRRQDFYNSEEDILNKINNIKSIIYKEFNTIKKYSQNDKYKLILDILLDIFSNNSDAEYFILHTPATLLVFDIVKNILTPYKLILMQRDIHTFFVSAMKGKNRWFVSEIDCIVYWNIVSYKLRKIQKEYKNSILIYQEMMLKNPEVVKKQLEEFLSINLNNICLKSNGENSYFNKNFDRIHLLNNEEINLIESLSKDNIIYFNYSLKNKSYINKNITLSFQVFMRKFKLLSNYQIRKYGYFYLFQRLKKIVKRIK